MQLKEIVDKILKERNRSLSWLATEMNKTFDGLKLGLVKGSVKYSDLKRMGEILDVSPAAFFAQEENDQILQDPPAPYYSVKNELAASKEMVDLLKAQVRDKERIIELLSKESGK